MYGSNQNVLGNIEKSKKVMEGDCIFPFTYKYKTHNECVATEKGDICATSVSKRRTLKTYGYCQKKNITGTKTLKKKRKLNIKTSIKAKAKAMEESKAMEDEVSKPTPPYNDDFISLLGKLEKVMIRKGEHMRARAYQKAQQSLVLYDKDITHVEEIAHLKGIGKTILAKFQEFIDTGKLKTLEQEKTNPMLVFTNIYGVGPKKAEELVGKGIVDIAGLRDNQDELNDKQKLGLKYYEDIEKRIPRSEIDQYTQLLEGVFRGLGFDGASMEIVGSYRRGAKDSGDIDVIITDKADNPVLLSQFVAKLVEDGILLHKLADGKTKVLGIARLPGKKIARRLDLLYTPPQDYAFAILYFTGSKIFNTVMRQRALDRGYTLNEHGIYKMVSGKKGPKVNQSFPDEKSIFDFLEMEYKKPEERKDARGVVGVGSDNDDDKKTVTTDKPVTDKPGQSVKKRGTVKKRQVRVTGIMGIMNNFVKKGKGVLEGLGEQKLVDVIVKANDLYYNEPDKVILTDDQYDIIREYLEDKYPDNPILKTVGAPIVGKKDKVMLPFPMPSMDKIKPSTKALDKWIAKYSKPSSYEVSAKLDGTSGLYTTIHGVGKLYTRGDGLIGKDISHLIPFLRLPDAKKHTGLVIRGEFVISKENFEKYFKSKGSKNARNTVAGLTNTLVGSADHAYVDYVGYEVMQPELTSAKQMEMMEKTLGMITVKHKTVSGLTAEMLSDLLVDWRQNYTYEIDGIIVAHNKIYKERKNKNPEHAFAFKMVLSDQVAEAKVVNILWTPSKDGYLKPRVQIEPIELGGVTIEYATGFNAEFIEKHKLGVGSVVELVRSGDVIPHIQKVIRGAKEPLMPDVDYVWNDTHVDIMLVDKGADPVVREKNILGFFKTLDVEGVGPGVVKKMMNAGYSSVPAILRMKKDDFLGLEGFKEKMADKVYMHIQNGVEKATLPMLMKASNIFGRGFGEKKLKPVLKKYPTLLVDKESDAEKIAKLMTVEGWSTKSSTAFVKHIDTFIAFLKECGLYERFVVGVGDGAGVGDGGMGDDGMGDDGVDVSHPLYGKKVVMTGFRDKELANLIESVGGEIGSSVSKKTFVVLVKDLNEDTGKAEQARQLGVSLMTPDGFKQMYMS